MFRKKRVLQIGIVFIILLVLIQFIPMTKNNGSAFGEQDITNCVPVSPEVKQLLVASCNDCHSNATVYPWYSRIQPVGFWLNHHVEEGKSELNFSEFASYKKKRQLHKLDEVVEMVESGEMPLSSYTLIHKNATLNDAQMLLLVNWAKAAKRHLQQDSSAASN
jgi:hypothetical protein